MDDAARMSKGERRSNLACNLKCVVECQLLLACQAGTERATFRACHDIVEELVDVPRLEQRNDMRVLKRGNNLDFAEKPAGPEQHTDLGVEDLYCDVPIVAEVTGLEDGRHTTTAELALDAISAR